MNLHDCIGKYDSTSTEVAAFRKGISHNSYVRQFLTCPIQGNFHTITDLLLASPQDIAKRCKLSPVEVKKRLEKILDAVPLIDLNRLDTFPADEIFSTGDQILDKAIGGGIRTGMIWEVVGERYFFQLSLSFLCQKKSNFFQCCGKDAARPSTLLIRSSTFYFWGFIRCYMLSDNVLYTTHYTFATNSRSQPTVIRGL